MALSLDTTQKSSTKTEWTTGGGAQISYNQGQKRGDRILAPDTPITSVYRTLCG